MPKTPGTVWSKQTASRATHIEHASTHTRKEHMCTRRTRNEPKRLARLAKLTEKPTPNLLPTKDTWPTLLCSSTHTNPACPVNIENKLSSVTLKILKKQRPFIHSFDTYGNKNYDASGHCEDCIKMQKRRVCILLFGVHIYIMC